MYSVLEIFLVVLSSIHSETSISFCHLLTLHKTVNQFPFFIQTYNCHCIIYFRCRLCFLILFKSTKLSHSRNSRKFRISRKILNKVLESKLLQLTHFLYLSRRCFLMSQYFIIKKNYDQFMILITKYFIQKNFNQNSVVSTLLISNNYSFDNCLSKRSVTLFFCRNVV